MTEETVFITGYTKDNLQISKQQEILGWKQNSKRRELAKGDYVFVYDIDNKKINCLFQIDSRIESNDLLWKDEVEFNNIKYKNRWKANLILDNLNIDKNEILSIFPFNNNPNRFFLFIKNPFPNFLDENFQEFRSFLLTKNKVHNLITSSNAKSGININNQNNQIQYFLVQVNELGSKNILNNNFYEHLNWDQTPRDKDHGMVKTGDILLVYFASQSIKYKKQLKKIYRVIEVKENHVRFQLSEEMELNGLSLDTIKQEIKTGELSTVFNKISQQGFNITKIDKSDYDSILILDKISMAKASRDPSVWIVRAGDTGQGEQSALENNYVSIGYNGLPGLHLIKDFEKFKEHYMKTHPNESIGRIGKVVPQIWNFIFEIKIGDFIILPLKTHKSNLIAVGKIVGEYQYENLNSGIQQSRPVKWLKKDVNINDFDKDLIKLFDEHGTVYRIGGLTEVNKLKDMLKRLGVKEIDLEEINNISTKSIQLENNENKKPLSLEDISKITYFPIQILKEIEDLLTEKKQIIFYGSPGTSKTFLAKKFSEYFTNNKENVRIIQFHQSYSYEDFIEGIKPKISENGDVTGFTLQSGLFKNLVKECIANPANRFVLIIDEINRGNISKIFGELIYLLEYRDEKISLTYSPLEEFFIPSNLYIIGTMNSADRSIAFVDYALRRRFYFKEFYPDTNGDILYLWYKANNIKEVDPKQIVTLLSEINKKISELIGKEYQIGYSYFMVKNLDRIKLKNIIDYAIAPLVEQYFFGKKQKVEEIKQIWSSILNTTTSDSQTSIH